MSGTMIEKAALTKAALTLFDEGYSGPADPKGTWFVDNDPDCGFIGTIQALSAARGENAYAGAKWSESWTPRVVSDAEWKSLVEGLRAEYAAFREALAKGGLWDDEDMLTGTLGSLCHGAWHLGAIRQALGLIKAPA
jgi:hypothetical protein